MNEVCEFCDYCIEHNGKAFCLKHGEPTDWDKPMCGGADSPVITMASDIDYEPEVYNY